MTTTTEKTTEKVTTPFNKTDASCQVYAMYASPAAVKAEEHTLRNFMYDMTDVTDEAVPGCIVVPYKFSRPASIWYQAENFKEVEQPYFIDVKKGLVGFCIDSFAVDVKCMFSTFQSLYKEYSFKFDSRVVTAYFDSFYTHNGSKIIGFDVCMDSIIKQRMSLDIGLLLPKAVKMGGKTV